MSQPPQKDKYFPDDEKRSENRLVMPGKPSGKVDIKIGPPIIGVPRSHAGQRALPAIEEKDDNFQEHEGACPRSLGVQACPTQYRNRENARSENRPYARMDQLDRAQIVQN